MMKVVEETAGAGALVRGGQQLRRVRYQITRYQGMAESGLPIPGLFRVEGTLQLDHPEELINVPVSLHLEDGRSLPITLVDASGRVLSEGHGPLKCMCC